MPTDTPGGEPARLSEAAITEFERLERERTPAPWWLMGRTNGPSGGGAWLIQSRAKDPGTPFRLPGPYATDVYASAPCDAAFVVAACNNARPLLAELRRQRRVEAAARAYIKIGNPERRHRLVTALADLPALEEGPKHAD